MSCHASEARYHSSLSLPPRVSHLRFLKIPFVESKVATRVTNASHFSPRHHSSLSGSPQVSHSHL